MNKEREKKLVEQLNWMTGGRFSEGEKEYRDETVRRISSVFEGKRWRYRFDAIDTVLLLAMGREVRERLTKGMPFTQANQVHVPSLGETLAVRCRTTQSAKLGIVAKCLLRKEDVPPGSARKAGSQVPGVWVVTERGFAALRGEQCVPSWVEVEEGSLEARSGELITLTEALQAHREAVEAAIARKRPVKGDYRAQAASWRPEEWYELVPTGAVLQGSLL